MIFNDNFFLSGIRFYPVAILNIVRMYFNISFFSNKFRLFPSRSLSVTDSGTPDISKHSRLEYISFAQY